MLYALMAYLPRALEITRASVDSPRSKVETVSCHWHGCDLDPATGPLVDVDGSVDTVDPFGGALPEVDEQLDLARLGDCRARRSEQ